MWLGGIGISGIVGSVMLFCCSFFKISCTILLCSRILEAKSSRFCDSLRN